MREAFDLFDKDGDETISVTEFKSLFKCFGMKFTEQEIQKLVEEYDEDKSGEIDFEEFCKMMSNIILNDGNDVELEEAYRVFNPDCEEGDKGINADELQKVLKKFNYGITYEEAQDVINEADWDGDGYLSF